MRKIQLFLLLSVAVLTFSLCSCDDECAHSYETVTVESTCTSEGKVTSICKSCGDIKESILPAKGHSFTLSVTQADCSSAGYTKYSCECGYSYKSDITSAKGHDYTATVTAHTCTDNGYTTYKCKNCNSSYVSNVTAPIGHNFSSVVVAPTCTSQGYTNYACTTCSYSYTADYVKPLGHSYEPSVISTLTCTQSGEVEYTCNCGDSYSVITAPTGHDFEMTVLNTTVSDMGYTEYSCECGFNYIGNYRFYDEILDNAYASNDKVLAHGIDISSNNHTVNSDGEYEPIDWIALKEAGVDYVILKIGSTLRDNGTRGGMDPTFEMDYAGAKAAGIDVGVYFFTYSTTVSGIRKDAEWLLTYLDGKQFEYPVYLDLEPEKKENYHPENIASPILTEMMLTFFSTLQREGYYTGLYVNNEFLFNILQTDNVIELFEVWYVRLPVSGPYTWDVNDCETFVWNTEKYGEHLGMWQYTWEGQLPTINEDVDFDFAYKDYPSIIKHYGFNGY